jgi:hypothetical protein
LAAMAAAACHQQLTMTRKIAEGFPDKGRRGCDIWKI